MAMVDRISTLADQVLCHILSFFFLRMMLLPRMFFQRDGDSFGDQSPVSTLTTGDLQQPITSFRLKSEASQDYFSEFHVNTWVNAVIQRRVEILDLDLSIRLKLSFLRSKPCIWKKVGFSKAPHLMEVLCGCPVLEDLKVKAIRWEGPPCRGEFKHFPLLVRADISPICDLDIPLKAVSNAAFLSIFSKHYKCDGVIPVFPNLTHLEFISWSKYEWHLILEMLNQCHKLQILVLQLPISFADDWSHPSFVAECLSSNLNKCVVKNYKGIESHLQFAKYIMQNSQVLPTMTLQNDWESADRKSQMLQALSLCPRTCELSFQ
ncbi:FBD domain [Sesbania bispinosa]|nr:FBD domain [Sesbania bispinosa]